MNRPLAEKVRTLINYIEKVNNFVYVESPVCPYQNHIGALFTDIILQAGLNYKNVVEPRIKKILLTYPEAYDLETFSSILQTYTIEKVLNWHDSEKQLRMVRLVEFCKINNIQYSYQLRNFLLKSKRNSDEFLKINGIGKKTYDYTLKLLGVECVAVDRHIYKFVTDAGICYRNYDEAKHIVEYAADIMHCSRRNLDYSIWSYMSMKKGDDQLTFNFDAF